MINTFQLKNFKAVRDSKKVRFTPLTALIGNNGSGKSSLIEGLQTYQEIVLSGLDQAMTRWKGFENIHNPPLPPDKVATEKRTKIAPIEFAFNGGAQAGGTYDNKMIVGTNQTVDDIYIQSEILKIRRDPAVERDQSGLITLRDEHPEKQKLAPGMSIFNPSAFIAYRWNESTQDQSIDVLRLATEIIQWQFLSFNPYTMGIPRPQRRTGGQIRLEPDGSNIAEYLLDIRKRDQTAFNGIIEALQQVLPYAVDLRPELTSELERTVYLQLTEGQTKIPGWLLSTGTLRIVALLSVLRDPEPAPLIVIDEIENGLDPRTVHMIVEEMRNVIENSNSQIILTTHSPFLLDLLTLSQIVLVERNDKGEPIFTRPGDQPSLTKWSNKFAPGHMYTSGMLQETSKP